MLPTCSGHSEAAEGNEVYSVAAVQLCHALGWVSACVHIDRAAGLMQTPLKIPFSFLSQEYSIALPRKDVSVFHISPISDFYLFIYF